jgi:hypothetical protein
LGSFCRVGPAKIQHFLRPPSRLLAQDLTVPAGNVRITQFRQQM